MVPEGWVKIRLGSIAELQRGFDLPSSQRVDGCVPIVSSGGVTGYHNEAKSKAPGVVTGRYGSIGDVFYLEEDYWPLNTSLWVKDFHGNHEKFIYYLLSNFDFNKFSDKTGVPGVNRNDLHAVKVGLPPLPEQKKIAKILSTWDKAITSTEQLLANSQQQKMALMQQLLTGKKRLLDSNGVRFSGEWITIPLEKICHINPKRPPEPKDGLVSFIPMEFVSEDAKLLSTSERFYTEVSKGFTSFLDGDTLIAKITPCFENGKGCYVQGMKNGIGFGSTEFHVLRANKLSSPLYLYYMTNTSEFRIKGEANMQGSAGQKRVTTDYLKSLKVTVPKQVEEQQKIAAVLSTADQEISALQQKLAALKQEKKALMQQLLTGKRRVKVEAAA
ncbi:MULTISPECIES: restriction endonuclease subunit S [Aeromonas]|uniref:restriction endonuclease subunit S n=1 Tax=Aeromonas TaxID=642 RepID=UPI002B4A5CDA|nr:restriction endonuclease subunit S [Aeromonas caviae]